MLIGRFLNLGAGVQSSTLAEMIAEGDLPKVDMALFADTGNEPKWVYKQVDYLTARLKQVNIPVCTVRKSKHGILGDTIAGNGRFVMLPMFTQSKQGKIGRLRRQCTKEYKIEPINDFVLNWLVDHGFAQKHTDKNGRCFRRLNKRCYFIEHVFGISYDEYYRAGRNRGPRWQRAIYPLIERKLTRADCKQYLLDHGLPVPNKSSCIICPFHDNDYWQDMKQNHPEYFAVACGFDDWLRSKEARKRFTKGLYQDVYLHRSCKPLKKAKFAKADPDDELCGDHCFT